MDREQYQSHRNQERIPLPEALQKIYRFCAYQERSHQEVKNKLYSYGLFSNEVEETMSKLISEGFLNEERFAKAFSGGKFRMQKWGRNKIVHVLESKGLTQNCIRSGLREIEEPDYRKTLKEIIRKRSELSRETNEFKKRDKIARYAIARGFEAEMVWEMVKEMIR